MEENKNRRKRRRIEGEELGKKNRRKNRRKRRRIEGG
jgi:hypothetical protein